jgi:tellurite resistance protein
MRANNPPSKNKLKRPFELELLPNKRLLKAAALTDSVVVAAAVVAAVVEGDVDDMTTDRYQMSVFCRSIFVLLSFSTAVLSVFQQFTFLITAFDIFRLLFIAI